MANTAILYDVIQKRGKPLLSDGEYDSERRTLPSCVKAYRETNTVVLYYNVGYDSETQTLASRVILNMKQERQTLSSYVEYNREANCHGSVRRDDDLFFV